MIESGPIATQRALPARRVALLIDGDNISSDRAGTLITRSLALGDLRVKRVYGNIKSLPGWDAAPGFRMVHAGCGKNAADLLLAIEAIGLSHTGGIDTFVIASSDRDFTHLAHDLRERHFAVIGIGEAKAPEGFRKACTRFTVLPPAIAATSACPAPVAQASGPLPHIPEPPKHAGPSGPTEIDRHLRDLIRLKVQTEGMPIVLLGGRMHTLHDVRVSTLPERNWRAYLLARPHLYDCDPKGPNACVRWRGPA